MKSDVEIAKFVRSKILDSELMRTANGKLSDRGRPNGSIMEDIVISVLSNDGAGQEQNAKVNVNIYVKDQWNSETKAWEEHKQRVGELCNLCKFLFSIRGGDYHAVPKKSSQKVFPLGTSFEDGHTEHFINNKIHIEINNEEV